MLVTREFTFDAAHFLTNYYGKCERLHGHSYKLQVTLEGEVQSHGMVIDFVVLKRMVQKQVLDRLDHRLLNDVIENPSAERVVQWIWEQLENLPKLLSEEMEDPNLGQDIRALLEKSDQHGDQHSDQQGDSQLLTRAVFDKALRLKELKLWETPNAWVTYCKES